VQENASIKRANALILMAPEYPFGHLRCGGTQRNSGRSAEMAGGGKKRNIELSLLDIFVRPWGLESLFL
jgi:hypothetical protein